MKQQKHNLAQLLNSYHHMRMREKQKFIKEKLRRHYFLNKKLHFKHLELARYLVWTDALEWSA